MLEKNFENVLHKYPELIEDGLKFSGRQVSVGGKFVDLLFIDRFGQKLIIELKRGVIKREHVAQLLDYEGHFLTPDNPNIRVMLIGNRVPPNLRNSLDHHGFEWKEIPVSELIALLKNKDDAELLKQFDSELSTSIESGKETKLMESRMTKAMAMAQAIAGGGGTPEEIGAAMNVLMVAHGRPEIKKPWEDVQYVAETLLDAGPVVVTTDGRFCPYKAPEPAVIPTSKTGRKVMALVVAAGGGTPEEIGAEMNRLLDASGHKCMKMKNLMDIVKYVIENLTGAGPVVATTDGIYPV